MSEGLITLLDVNILIALCDGHHEHHAEASAWFVAHQAQGWASCPLTQNGAVRIMSLPSYPGRRPIAQVVAQVGAMCASKHHRFWPDDLSITDSGPFLHRHLLGPNQITDVYLLALAVRHQARLLTIDSAIPVQVVNGANKTSLLHLLKL